MTIQYWLVSTYPDFRTFSTVLSSPLQRSSFTEEPCFVISSLPPASKTLRPRKPNGYSLEIFHHCEHDKGALCPLPSGTYKGSCLAFHINLYYLTQGNHLPMLPNILCVGLFHFTCHSDTDLHLSYIRHQKNPIQPSPGQEGRRQK